MEWNIILLIYTAMMATIATTKATFTKIDADFMSRVIESQMQLTKHLPDLNGFVISTNGLDQEYIKCLNCGRKSYSRCDIENRYTHCCGKFHV